MHACLDACAHSGVEQLRPLLSQRERRVDEVCCVIAKCLVAATSYSLSLRRPKKAVWHVLRTCFMICTSWLFPPDLKWRRSNKYVELLWSACCVCRSLLWLSGNRHSRWGHKAGMLLKPTHRQAIWREDRPKSWTHADIRFHVDSLLGLQLAAVFPDLDLQGFFGVDPKECAGLYTWFSQRGYYVGIAHAQRPSKLGSCGIACRWLEHVALTSLRSHCRDSHRLRNKLMRGLLPQDFFFLVCRVSDWKRIAAMEQLEIRSRRPNANVRAQRPWGDLTCNKQRSRPPKLIRERAGSSNCGPFDAFDHAWCAPGVPHVDSPRLVHVPGPGPPSLMHCTRLMCSAATFFMAWLGLLTYMLRNIDVCWLLGAAPKLLSLIGLAWRKNGTLVVVLLLCLVLLLTSLAQVAKLWQLGVSMLRCRLDAFLTCVAWRAITLACPCCMFFGAWFDAWSLSMGCLGIRMKKHGCALACILCLVAWPKCEMRGMFRRWARIRQWPCPILLLSLVPQAACGWLKNLGCPSTS